MLRARENESSRWTGRVSFSLSGARASDTAKKTVTSNGACLRERKRVNECVPRELSYRERTTRYASPSDSHFAATPRWDTERTSSRRIRPFSVATVCLLHSSRSCRFENYPPHGVYNLNNVRVPRVFLSAAIASVHDTHYPVYREEYIQRRWIPATNDVKSSED